MMEVNEKKILFSIQKIISNPEFKELSLETKWRNVLFCLYYYRDFIEIVIKTENMKLISNILTLVSDEMIICDRNKKIISQDILSITKLCLMSEIIAWQKENFCIDTLPVHAHRMACISTLTPHFFWQLFS